MLKTATFFIPFVLYPVVFLGLFFQYRINPFLVGGLAVLSVAVVYAIGAKKKSKEKIGKFYKNANLFMLALICLILTVNIWKQVMEASIEDFIFQMIMLNLTFGLCVYSLLLESVSNREKAEIPFYRRVHELMNEVHFVLTCCVAALISNILLILMLRLQQNFPEFSSYTSRFLQRGVIPPLTLFLFVLGMLLLFSKYRKISRENEEIAKLGVPDSFHQSILHRSFMESTNKTLSRSGLESFMNLVYAESHSFYNLPRYLTWAIPILGFLGTVLGISLTAEGIGKLVDSESGLGELSADLSTALAPLGIAFDTTLVALSLSLVLVLIQLLMQRSEEKLLIVFESYMENSLEQK